MRGGPGMKAARALTWATMALAAGCVVAAVVCICTMGITYGIAPQVGEVLTYLYQINALTCLFLILFGVSVLFGRAPRTGLSKGTLWAVLLLCTMTIAPFVTDTIAYLPTMGFVSAFRLVCAYLPYMCLMASIIALLTTWDAPVHSALRDTNFIATLICVFSTVLYLWEVFPSLAQAAETYDRSQFLGIILGMLAITCQCMALWAICSSDELMARLFLRYDGQRAAAYVEARKAQRSRLDKDLEEAVAAEQLREQALAAASAAARGVEDEDELGPDQILDLARAARQEQERSTGVLDSSEELEDMRGTRDQERLDMYQDRLDIYKAGSPRPQEERTDLQQEHSDPDGAYGVPHPDRRSARRIPSPGEDPQDGSGLDDTKE